MDAEGITGSTLTLALPERNAARLQAGGSLPALFLISESLLEAPNASSLFASIDPTTDVYSLSTYSVCDGKSYTLFGMAARLLRTLRGLQPKGPYRLVGWSVSGLLAYEVANQLIGEDEEVEFLGLVDTECWGWQERQARLHALPSHEEQPAASELALASGESVEAAPSSFARRQRFLQAALEYDVPSSAVSVHLFATDDGQSTNDEAWRARLSAGQVSRVDSSSGEQFGSALAHALAASRGRARARESSGPLLATIQLGASSKPPLFCVPGAGAGAADFVSLAAALGDQHRVRAFQPRGMDGVLAPHSSVEAAARAYLVELLRSAPRGPVDLAGHSFGGWVAFEMARQLEASGRQVASLTLLDSECPLETHRVGREYTRVEALLHLISLYEEASGKKLQISPTSLQAREPEAQIALLHAELIRVGLMPARSSAGALLGPVRTFATALRTQYRPSGTFNGHTRLMLVRRASETELAAQLRFEKVLAHWRVLAPYTEFKVGQGNHVTLLKTPHVRELADWMLVASGNPYESGVRLRVDASALTPARAVSSVRGA